jgi:aspartyl-tRNA(Asn)/glutamyl-tRNA(Gln) amidotransferase subunit C
MGSSATQIPLGTHFLWHILNGIMLGWMIEVYRRHMLAPPILAPEGQGGKRDTNPSEAKRHPMSIDTDTAARVAKLARIRVDDSDLPELAQAFNAILGFIEQLNEVDVEGVEPMTSVTPMRLKRRDDTVTDGNQQDKVLSNAPDAREGFFAVPKVVE